ncbi:MAG: hypothetical protein E6K81_00745 [Candidatus Eisenbacteria bacterium]|uniref:Uncharacterized protein n=1 Tax=Eiseniibacteriota bacterium TaxID=2212470 RepID=A0A538UE71_UNCEI|nr:MAG: hypothetical protein E6K81_00745 [Candidatus Eisenbacteria bacterium]
MDLPRKHEAPGDSRGFTLAALPSIYVQSTGTGAPVGGDLRRPPGAFRPERTDDFFVAFARVTLRVFDVIFLAAIGHLLQ